MFTYVGSGMLVVSVAWMVFGDPISSTRKTAFLFLLGTTGLMILTVADALDAAVAGGWR